MTRVSDAVVDEVHHGGKGAGKRVPRSSLVIAIAPTGALVDAPGLGFRTGTSEAPKPDVTQGPTY